MKKRSFGIKDCGLVKTILYKIALFLLLFENTMRSEKQLSDRMLSWHAWVLGTAIKKQTNKK